MLLAVGSLAEPHIFRGALRGALNVVAWASGLELQIGNVEGSLFEPVALLRSHCTYHGNAGAIVRIEMARLEAGFNWTNIFRPEGHHWLERLTLDGATAKIFVPTAHSDRASRTRGVWRRWIMPSNSFLPTPARIEARDATMVVQANGDYLRIDGAQLDASTFEPGTISARRITLKQPWMHRTFHNVHGSTALQDARLVLANLTLEPGVDCRTLSIGLNELRAGELDMELQLAAFGGRVRCQAQTVLRKEGGVLDATAEFSHIDIAKLAAFAGNSEAAGGIINEGRFSFRGAPRHAARGTASLRLEAANFQWDSRQWDSLILGATLMDGRIQLPEFELRQGSNHLSLSGEMALPAAGMKWWENEVRCEIAANIDDVTALSALLLPEYRYATGKISIDGSVRAKDKQFHGQLILSGAGLKWRDAPIENLHVAVKLTGNECRLTSIQLFSQGDYLRGRGVVNILGPTQYWGELRGSVDELATYSALLQKPILPEPLAGGGVIEWSGEGSAKGHSGQFTARLNRIRPVGALAAHLHPINVDLEAQYGPGLMNFSRFALADEDSTFTAKVVVGEKALSVREVRLMQGEQLRLEGDAILPLDLWKAWPNTSLDALLTDGSASKINLAAYDLNLAQASLLTGWIFPISGVARGALTIEGPIDDLHFGGQMAVAGARFPLWSGAGVVNDLDARLSGSGSKVIVESLTARHPVGPVQVDGSVDLKIFRAPHLDLRVSSTSAMLPLSWIFPCENTEIETALALAVSGSAARGTIRGEASIASVARSAPIDLTSLWSNQAATSLSTKSEAARSRNQWTCEVALRINGSAPIRPLGGEATGSLQLRGSAHSPTTSGLVEVTGAPALLHRTALALERLTMTLPDAAIHSASVDVVAHGELAGESFTLFASGPLNRPLRLVIAPPPLTEEAVWEMLESRSPDTHVASPRFSLRSSAPIGIAIDVLEWSEIHTPAPPEAGTVTISRPPASFDGFF